MCTLLEYVNSITYMNISDLVTTDKHGRKRLGKTLEKLKSCKLTVVQIFYYKSLRMPCTPDKYRFDLSVVRLLFKTGG